MAAKKIMVVDDEKVVCTAFEKQLGSAGYEVKGFLSGKDAIEAAKNEHFDMAYVDLWMPGLSGVETCKRLKKVSPNLEVVLISGRPDGFSGKEGEFVKVGGLDFFLYKPFSEGQLLDVTRKVLKED